MKVMLLLLIFTIGISLSSQGQGNEVSFRVFLPEASNKSIFDENPDLHHMHLSYRNNEVASIAIYVKDGKDGNWLETLYTHFEGDCYILSKKYPSLILPQMPKLDVWNFNNLKNLRDSNIESHVSTILKRDTLVHSFNYKILQKGIYDFTRPYGNTLIIRKYTTKDSSTRSDTGYFAHPEPKGKISRFGKELSQVYKQWKPIAVVDSALMITVIVEKNGSLSDIQLKMGRQSAFSDRILEFIVQEVKEWWPQYIDSVSKIRSRTKIFVRLNRDDTVTFATL